MHKGHEHFIASSFKVSDRVTIGLATSKLSESKPLSYVVEDYEARLSGLKKYLLGAGFSDRASIVRINDIFGNSLEEKNIDAIFVTRHGLSAARLINKKRREKGFKSLKINKINFVRGEDNKIISSTRIRMGEIDKDGFPYIRIFTKTLKLPSFLRSEVRSIPKGELIKTKEELANFVLEEKFIISVGDIISANLIELGRRADISIVDLKSRRERLDSSLFADSKISVQNSAGTINKNVPKAFKRILNQILKSGGKQTIKIIGEEDLMPLPATLLAPLGALVLYGMPDRGAIAVRVTEEKKKEVEKILKQFSPQ